MLLPKSQSDQRNGEPQKPGAQRREESARRASPRAAAKPSGRQQLTAATEPKTAAGCDGHSATYRISIFIDERSPPANLCPSGSDSARLACEVPCHSCAEPNAVRSPVFADSPACPEHPPASPASGGAPARRAAF